MRSLNRLLVGLLAVGAVAVPQGALGGYPRPKGPVYNPHTKSYFELRTDLLKSATNHIWPRAEQSARTKVYKGVYGRLAIVRDLETHMFLKKNFPVFEEAWIGLRYFCSFRKLVWVDGTIQEFSDFKVWAKQWHRTRIKCSTENIKYMPVTYTPTADGFHWQATGEMKGFVSYFVEYPTGKK